MSEQASTQTTPTPSSAPSSAPAPIGAAPGAPAIESSERFSRSDIVAQFEAELNAENGEATPAPEQREQTPHPAPKREPKDEDETDPDAGESEEETTETEQDPPAEAGAEEDSEAEAAEPSSDPENQEPAEDDNLALPGMSEADQAVFAKLPPELRDWVSTREANRQADYTRKTTAISEQKRELDQSIGAALQRVQAYDSILSEFTDQKLEPPDPALRATDPYEYEDQLTNYVYRKDQQEKAANERQRLANEAQELQTTARKNWLVEQGEKLKELEPTFADKKRGPKLRKQMKDYAKKQGYTDQQLANISAQDSVVLLKAMRYDAAMAQKKAEPKPKPKDPPTVAKPGVSKGGRPSNVAVAVRNFDEKSNPGRGDLAAMFEAELAAESRQRR
ncbi:MAG: hypothetical protein AAGD43_06805 [Pseudomonadota bacterium]